MAGAQSDNLDDYEHLHQVRILGKRLRYAMEVFADCFALAFREKLYPMVEQMQEVLGNANDSYVAGRRLEALSAWLQALVPGQWKRLRPGLEGLRRYHRARLPQQRQHFQDWWERWHRLGGTRASLLAGSCVIIFTLTIETTRSTGRGPFPGPVSSGTPAVSSRKVDTPRHEARRAAERVSPRQGLYPRRMSGNRVDRRRVV